MADVVVVKALRRLIQSGQFVEPDEYVEVSADSAESLVAEGSAEITKKRPKPAADPAE